MRNLLTDSGWPQRAALGIVLLDSLLLSWVGMGWVDQFTFLLIASLWTLAGANLATRVPQLPRTRIALLAVSVAFGMCVHMLLCFITFHRGLYTSMNTTIVGGAWIACVGLLGLAVRGSSVFLRAWQEYRDDEAGVGALFLLVASVVAAFAAFGYGNAGAAAEHPWSILPSPQDWGTYMDRGSHLASYPHLILAEGLPVRAELFRNFGVQFSIMGMSLLGGTTEFGHRVNAFSKPLCILWYFLALYGQFAIARHALRHSVVAATLSATALLFYGAINLTWFTEGVRAANTAANEGIRSSSILYIASSSTYYNIPQLASVAAGFAGLLLVLLDLQSPGRGFVSGCFLLASSFFYKQVLYTVVVPSVGLALLFQFRKAFTPSAVAGLAMLGTVAVFYFTYPRITGTELRVAPVAIDVLWPYRVRPEALHVWPPSPAMPFARDSLETRLLSLVLCGYAAWFIPLGALALQEGRPAPPHERGGVRGNDARLASSQASSVLWCTFAFGTLGAMVLVENNELWAHGNFFWGFAIGQFCIFPFLMHLIGNVRSRLWRILAYGILGLHLASGAGNLYLLALNGDIGI